MIQHFSLFVLQRHSRQSHTYVGELPRGVDRRPMRTVEFLEKIVRKYIKSRREFKSWGKDVDDIHFDVYRLPQNLQGLGVIEMAQSDQLEAVADSTVLGRFENPQKLVFVFGSLPFRFVLFQTIGSTHKCLTMGRATALYRQNVGVIEQAARDCVKAYFHSNFEADVCVWEPEQPFEVDDPLTGRSKERLDELVNEEFMDTCFEYRSGGELRNITHREHLIITFTLRFDCFLFERGPTPSPCIGYREVVGSSEDPVQIIQRAAEKHIKVVLIAEDGPTVEHSVRKVNVYEPRSSYKEAYRKGVEQMNSLSINHKRFKRLAKAKKLVTRFAPEDPLKKISNSNLIVECVVTRRRKLQFECVLFERRSGSFKFAGHDFVEGWSDQTMQVILDTVRDYIESLPGHSPNTGHSIQVYEPTKAFAEVYNKPTWDVYKLKLEEQHLQADPAKCLAHLPQKTLSGVDPSQTLIVVFGLPSKPSSTSLDVFLGLKVATEAPSKVSRRENYQTLQNQPLQRILDDRPCADLFIPPISLLYDGFGIFDDVRHGRRPVPGERDILEAKLWDEVGTFADQMAKFYDTEADRRGVALRHLGRIFRARRNPQAVGWSTDTSCVFPPQTDKHLKGAHGAIVFCIKCKNELSNISCEPSAELVSCVANSFREQWEGAQRDLFDGWRVPALGMTQIGSFVQFFGIVVLGQMRIVPLTPMLPLATSIDDERSRQALFLVFKAASIIIAKIQADTLKLIQKTPPKIPYELRRLPSVTEIQAVAPSSSSRINFALVGRHDADIYYRNLYHARLAPTNEDIYVKFTERYSRDLHVFCAERGLAPKLLGFEQVPGGWFAVAMEKIDIVKPREVKSLSELDTWKKDIRELVEDFHRKGLVHGDLRLPNFIFTKDCPRRMLLIDFDWGGKEKEVCFPRGPLDQELRAQNGQDDCLDRPITREDDDRVLAGTFKRLDELAALLV